MSSSSVEDTVDTSDCRFGWLHQRWKNIMQSLKFKNCSFQLVLPDMHCVHLQENVLQRCGQLMNNTEPRLDRLFSSSFVNVDDELYWPLKIKMTLTTNTYLWFLYRYFFIESYVTPSANPSYAVHATVFASVQHGRREPEAWPSSYSHWWLFNLPSCGDECLSSWTTHCAPMDQPGAHHHLPWGIARRHGPVSAIAGAYSRSILSMQPGP